TIVGALACLLMPFTCGLVAVTVTALLGFLNQELSIVTAMTSGVTLTFDISYQWDATANLVNPVVTLTGTTGTVTVVPTWRGPILNGLQIWVESVLAVTMNSLNLWVAAVGLAAAKALETNLRTQGLSFPFGAGDLGLTAVSGSARSAPSTSLTLMAEVGPTRVTSSLPYVTQVIPVDELATQLETSQAAMRNDILTSTMPAPAADSYGAFGISQNALNYYIYSQWLQGLLACDITDSTTIAKLVNLLPAGTFGRSITRIHAWPAVSPRVEVAEQALIAQQRPLLVTMDDVRVCFEALGPWTNDIRQPTVVGELIANLKVAATLTLEWPLVPKLRVDSRASQIVDQRVWEVMDPNQPPGTSTATAQWDRFVAAIGNLMLAPYDAAAIRLPPTPFTWRNPVPAGMPQGLMPSIQAPPLVPQSLYV